MVRLGRAESKEAGGSRARLVTPVNHCQGMGSMVAAEKGRALARRNCGRTGGNAYNRAVNSHREHAQSGNAEENLFQEGAGRKPVAGRVLGLDVGSRRIGVAVSDPLGITAQGLETLERRNKKYDFEQLKRVIRRYEVKEIVVGLPLRMSGAEGIQSDKMNVFADELRRRFRLPVHLYDERLTSAEANRLLRETDLSIEKRGKAVDRMAAILILQGWMERRQISG
jgi:putative holliday junction resolvase